MLGIAGLLKGVIGIQPGQQPRTFDLRHGICRAKPGICFLEARVVP